MVTFCFLLVEFPTFSISCTLSKFTPSSFLVIVLPHWHAKRLRKTSETHISWAQKIGIVVSFEPVGNNFIEAYPKMKNYIRWDALNYLRNSRCTMLKWLKKFLGNFVEYKPKLVILGWKYKILYLERKLDIPRLAKIGLNVRYLNMLHGEQFS